VTPRRIEREEPWVLTPDVVECVADEVGEGWRAFVLLAAYSSPPGSTLVRSPTETLFVEDDSITFSFGTGQFAGLSGTASFHTFSAGARFTGALRGTLSA
jgi:hypothetical protein